MPRWALSIVVGVAVSAPAAQAHHSLSGVYETARQVTVEGRISEFHFINPHPYITVDVVDRAGRAQPWRLELDNRWELSEIGVTNSTFTPGDRIVVTGNPGRTQLQSLYVRALDRPADGFRYEQVGTRPRIGRK